MYVLINEEGEMFAGKVCGCITNKRHWTRACIYQTIEDAEEDLKWYDLEGYTVEDLEELKEESPYVM